MYNFFHSIGTLLQKSLLASLILCFGALAVLGLGLGMEHNPDGGMKDCVFMVDDGMSVVCTMSVAEHLMSWQQFLLMSPQNNLNSLLGTIAVGILMPALLLCTSHQKQETPSFKLQRWRARIMKLFDYLLQAFSQGLLRSKVY